MWARVLAVFNDDDDKIEAEDIYNLCGDKSRGSMQMPNYVFAQNGASCAKSAQI